MQETRREHVPFVSRLRPVNGNSKPQPARGVVRRPAPSEFDLIVTFASDEQAREALLALRREGFGPNQAVLLTRGPLAQDEFELATEILRRESYTAFAIIAVTEIIVGTLVGATIGWLIGLFLFQPAVGPIWQPILVAAGIGLLVGIVVTIFDFFRWRNVHLPSPGEAAIALRIRGGDAPVRLARAEAVLQQFGGQREAG